MKHFLAVLLMAGALCVLADTPRQVLKTTAVLDPPVRIGSKGSVFRQAILMGYSAQGVSNASYVFVGAATNNAAQYFMIAPGEVLTWTLPDGVTLDLYDLTLDVAATNDGICVLFW